MLKYVVITSVKPYLKATTLQTDKMEEELRCCSKLLPKNTHWTAISLLPFRKFATPLYMNFYLWWIKIVRCRNLLTGFHDYTMASLGSTLDIIIPKINFRLRIIKFCLLVDASSNEEIGW